VIRVIHVITFDSQAKPSLRRELGLAPATRFVECFARFHPQKDHGNLISGAELPTRHVNDVHFVLCGGHGISYDNQDLAARIEGAGLRKQFHLQGRRDDLPMVMAAMDVCTLTSSHGEAAPSSIAEATACEVPCVVTDVADCRVLVGTTGVVVPPKTPGALADGWRTVLEMTPEVRSRLGAEARRRISEHFSLQKMVVEYETLHSRLSERHPSTAR